MMIVEVEIGIIQGRRCWQYAWEQRRRVRARAGAMCECAARGLLFINADKQSEVELSVTSSNCYRLNDDNTTRDN